MRASTVILLVLVAALSVTSAILWLRLEDARIAAGATDTGPGLRGEPQGPEIPGQSGVLEGTEFAADQGRADLSPDGKVGLADDGYRLYQNESFREAQRKIRKLELMEGHIDMTKVMGISRETADRLLALLVDQEMRYFVAPRPNPRNDAELQARMLETERLRTEQDAEIAGIIGEFNVERWHRYQASLPVRHQVRELRLEMADSGSPLREDQVEPLVEIISSERQRTNDRLAEFQAGLVWSEGMETKSGRYLNARQAELDREADDRIRVAAGRILSRDQLEALIDKMRRDRDLRAARLEARRAAIEASRLVDTGD
jgi:hypothetical protein